MRNFRAFALLLSSIIMMTGCSKYGFVNLNYPANPVVVLPGNIKTIAVVNRSLVKGENKRKKIVETILSGEVAGSDKIASDNCLKGVFDAMNNHSAYSIVIPGQTHYYGTGTSEVPDLLNWELVSSICDSAGADALLVLENFDYNTDYLLTTAGRQFTSIVITGKPDPRLNNRIKFTVKSYWRLYQPSTRTISDQFECVKTGIYMCEGPLNNIPPAMALLEMAYSSGLDYGNRFVTSYYTVRRDMYKRGKGSSKREFRTAFRKAEMADWQNAITDWKKIVETSSRKNAGRACLDIAVSCEVLGNTEMALQWARKGYVEYRNKLARDYAKILLDRKNFEQKNSNP